MDVLLVLLLGDLGLLALGEPPPDRAGLLVAEVEGEVLRVLVELAEVVTLLLVDDGEDAGDRLADGRAVEGKGRRWRESGKGRGRGRATARREARQWVAG